MATVFDDDPAGDAGWRFDHWRDGQTYARIIWTDGLGAEHEAVIFDEREALSLLGEIRTGARLRLSSCKVR